MKLKSATARAGNLRVTGTIGAGVQRYNNRATVKASELEGEQQSEEQRGRQKQDRAEHS